MKFISFLILAAALYFGYERYEKWLDENPIMLATSSTVPSSSLGQKAKRDLEVHIRYPSIKGVDKYWFGYYVSGYEDSPDDIEFYMGVFDNTDKFVIDKAELDPINYRLSISFSKKKGRELKVANPKASYSEFNKLYRSVGQALIKGERRGEAGRSCTAFVVGKRYVVTNNHCISDQKTCDRAQLKIWDSKGYRFQLGALAQTYRCDRVNMTDKVYDFTLFETYNDPAAKYGKISIAGKNYKYTKGSPIAVLTNNKSYEIKIKKCKVGSRLNSIYCSFKRAVCYTVPHFYKAEGCHIIQGDSGSPVVNRSGELVGVLFASGGENVGVFSAVTPLIYKQVKKVY